MSFGGSAGAEPSASDLKLSDRGVRRGTCMVGGKAAAEAGAVTHGAVRCSAWLGHVRTSGTIAYRLRFLLRFSRGWSRQAESP